MRLEILVLAVGATLPAVAAAGVFNSKNVYDNVIVFTSFGNFGSTTKTTGKRLVWFAVNVCCVKQKHSIFLKYSVVCFGA